MAAAHGTLLRRKIRLAGSLVDAPVRRFWEHEKLTDLFPRFLLTIHGSVRATVPLMNAALSVLSTCPPDDAARPMLTAYLEQHVVEEADHEEWLLQDLEVLGFRRSDVLDRVSPPAIASLVGAQYYWVHHAHPVALLGFFAVLEGHPPTIEHLDQVQRRTGLPSDAFRMLRQHAELDQHHAEELFDLLDRLPLSPRQVMQLGVSAFHTLDALAAMFEGLVASPPEYAPA